MGEFVDFYLANFLGSNSYIINTWQTLDLSYLAGAESLQFGLSSADNDPTYDMNTPAYFAIDNLMPFIDCKNPNGHVQSPVEDLDETHPSMQAGRTGSEWPPLESPRPGK